MVAEWDIEDVRLVTGDLVRRPWRASDADAVYRACQGEQIQRWTSVPVPCERRHVETFVTAVSRAAWPGVGAAPLDIFHHGVRGPSHPDARCIR